MGDRTPSFQEMLGNSFDFHMADIYTSIPGIVVSVDNLADQRITVQPAINMRSEDGVAVTERPPILNVPLHMPVTKQGGLTYPISVGTPVFLMFSMRGLQNWKRSNGYPTTPSDTRKFDIRDCVAIPGIYPFSEAQNKGRVNAHSTDDVVLVHNIGGSECEIRLKPNGDVIVNSPNQVQVNCVTSEVNASSSTTINAPENTVNGNMTVNGDFTNTSGSFTVTSGSIAMSASTGASMNAQFNMNGDIILNGKSVDNHTHKGVVAGGDETSPFNA